MAHTDRHTDTQTDMATLRPTRPRGPSWWKFKKIIKKNPPSPLKRQVLWSASVERFSVSRMQDFFSVNQTGQCWVLQLEPGFGTVEAMHWMNQLFTDVVIAEWLYWVPRMCIDEENDLISLCALSAYIGGTLLSCIRNSKGTVWFWTNKITE